MEPVQQPSLVGVGDKKSFQRCCDVLRLNRNVNSSKLKIYKIKKEFIMKKEEKEDMTIYEVVVNHEEQYSIWPEYKKIPLGWKTVGKEGLKQECLDYIKEVWTDMRPLSLRKKMVEMEKMRPELEKEHQKKLEEERKKPKDPRDDLVKFLSEGDHPVEVGLRPEKTLKLFKEALDREYVHIKFTDTRGGTELGFKLDKEKSDFENADLDMGSGKIHIEGGLTLNYQKVQCIADIGLEMLTGHGHLKLAE
jgi:uncharacterized protein YbdZ (MbtH family)